MLPMVEMPAAAMEAPAPTAIPIVVAPVVEIAPAPAPAPAIAVVDRVHLYVNCSIDGIQTQSFWPLVNHITNELSTSAGGDYRYVDKLSYGKWEGAVAAALRQLFTTGRIPPGHYVFDGANTRTAAVIVETMRDLLGQGRGVLIWGTR